MEKTHINNCRFMEFIDEMATQITEMNFGEYTYKETIMLEGSDRQYTQMMFSEEANDFYMEKYDEYEAMANNIMGVYSDNELTQQEWETECEHQQEVDLGIHDDYLDRCN